MPALAAWGFVVALVGARLLAQPITPYGTNGAEYIEHVDRLRVGRAFREWLEDPYSPLELLRLLDGAFPPLLHLITQAVPGVGLAPVAWSGLLWLGALAAVVGGVGARLSSAPRVGVVAAVGTLLLPAMHGAASRYYYDLPMTVLVWGATAALVRAWDRPPGVAHGVAGLLSAAACLIKWTAVPYLLVLQIAAVLAFPAPDAVRWRPPRRRITALIVVVAAQALACGVYLAALGEDNSLSFTAMESGVVEAELDDLGLPTSEVAHGLLGSMARRITDPATPPWMRILYYGTGWTLSTCSPILAGALVLLVFGAALRRRRTAAFAAWVAAGHMAFLLLLVQPIDDRFLLTMTPALVIAGADALVGLGPRVGRALGVALVVVAVLVGVDFHHGRPTALTKEFLVAPRLLGRDMSVPPPVGRGIGAASSTLRLGWSRRDESPPLRAALREALWEALRRCDPEQLWMVDEQPVVGPEGDGSWLEYRLQLAAARREAHHESLAVHTLRWQENMDKDGEPLRERDIVCVDPTADGSAPLLPNAMVLAQADADGSALAPMCPTGVTWRLESLVADPDGGPGVALWSVGTRGCR